MLELLFGKTNYSVLNCIKWLSFDHIWPMVEKEIRILNQGWMLYQNLEFYNLNFPPSFASLVKNI